MVTPAPIVSAIQFVESTNHYRMHGCPIDGAQTLAAKAALVTIRDYFASLQGAIASGDFSPAREIPAWLLNDDTEEDGASQDDARAKS